MESGYPPKEYRLPVSGETLWTARVEPSLTGSGALPPNPTFSETPAPEVPTPEVDALLKAFSTPVDLERNNWFP